MLHDLFSERRETLIRHDRAALIGAAGFVGSNLRPRNRPDAWFSSRTIETIRGKTFDRIVCCGVPAVKWGANQEPQTDRTSSRRLVAALREHEYGVQC